MHWVRDRSRHIRPRTEGFPYGDSSRDKKPVCSGRFLTFYWDDKFQSDLIGWEQINRLLNPSTDRSKMILSVSKLPMEMPSIDTSMNKVFTDWAFWTGFLSPHRYHDYQSMFLPNRVFTRSSSFYFLAGIKSRESISDTPFSVLDSLEIILSFETRQKIDQNDYSRPIGASFFGHTQFLASTVS